jgi:hypothetical protein
MPMALLSILIGAAAAFCGVALLFNAFARHRDTRASAHWPTAPGVVEHSALTERPSRGRTRNTLYGVAIRYRYMVGGKALVGQRVFFGDDGYESSGGAWQRALVQRYPVGTAVAVRYDPDAPERCVLEPGNPRGYLVQLGSGIAATLAGGTLAYFAWTQG